MKNILIYISLFVASHALAQQVPFNELLKLQVEETVTDMGAHCEVWTNGSYPHLKLSTPGECVIWGKDVPKKYRKAHSQIDVKLSEIKSSATLIYKNESDLPFLEGTTSVRDCGEVIGFLNCRNFHSGDDVKRFKRQFEKLMAASHEIYENQYNHCFRMGVDLETKEFVEIPVNCIDHKIRILAKR